MPQITVVGSISTDFVIEADQRPNVGETIEGINFKTTFGGKGANQAVACARLGSSVEMVGTVGTDVFGDQLLENLVKNGISVNNVERVTHLPSGSAHITVVDGDNAIVYIAGANNALTSQQIIEKQTTFENSDMVVVQNEVPQEAIEALIDLCHEKGVPVLLNPAPARLIDKSYIDKVTFLTPNESEFEVLFAGKELADVLPLYPNKLLVTVGSKGVYYHDGEQVKLVPAYKVTPVDTTGAGDTFNGAFAVAYTSGLSIEESIKFGNLAASLSIQKFGAQQGIPTLDEMKGCKEFEKEWHIEQ